MKRRVVLLGMMSRMPVAGVVWQTVHYLLGLERLGYEANYVESHGRTPSMLMDAHDGDGSAKAAGFIDAVMRRFGLAGRWAYHALHGDGAHYGMSEGSLGRLYRSADLIVNLHGGTMPLPAHVAGGRLVYVETDPVQLQVELAEGDRQAIEFLDHHSAYFTFAENYGAPDCRLPVSGRFDFRPTRQPVVLELWERHGLRPGTAYTTIGNWRQEWRPVTLDGEVYTWSKHDQFLRFLDLPGRSGRRFELALGSFTEDDRRLLEESGWIVRSGPALSARADDYRSYIAGSRGEFTVAKDQNVRLRSGWFSDRSATYLAAGRPVVTQETGFSNVLPTGEGLFAFSSMAEAVDALEAIEAGYAEHSRRAGEIAREYFDAGAVLGDLLAGLGLPNGDKGRPGPSPSRIPPDLDLSVVSRFPTTLNPATVAALPSLVLHGGPSAQPCGLPGASIVVVSSETRAITKLCLASVLAERARPTFEVIVVDNGSRDGSVEMLEEIAARDGRVSLIRNRRNRGFATATNQGLAAASGEALVLLNSDAIVPPGWLTGLVGHLADRSVGLVGAVTNRAGNEQEIAVPYRTYGQMLGFARRVAAAAGVRDVRTALMFCAAMRREVYERLGPLDERFEVALFEDEDYSERVRRAGLRVVCAEDVFVHHFGQASLGRLAADGTYGKLFHTNRGRFESKWGRRWRPYERRPCDDYALLLERIRGAVCSWLPDDARLLVVSKGDDDLLALGGRRARHFPQGEDGEYAGYHPADSGAAVAELELRRREGSDFLLVPSTSLWWLDYYAGLREHLTARYRLVLDRPDTCAIFALEE